MATVQLTRPPGFAMARAHKKSWLARRLLGHPALTPTQQRWVQDHHVVVLDRHETELFNMQIDIMGQAVCRRRQLYTRGFQLWKSYAKLVGLLQGQRALEKDTPGEQAQEGRSAAAALVALP